MRNKLSNKLHEYIRENNPDMLVELEENHSVSAYLEDRVAAADVLLQTLTKEGLPDYLIGEQCMEMLTQPLLPSRYNYVRAVLEDEFETRYQQLTDSGLLLYEVINMIDACAPVFEAFHFSVTTEDDPQLRNAVIGTIAIYFGNNK